MSRTKIEELVFLEYRLKLITEMENSISDVSFLMPKSISQTKEDFSNMINAWNFELSELHNKRLEVIEAINDLDNPDSDYNTIVEGICLQDLLDEQPIRKYNESFDDGLSDEDRVMRIIDRGDGDQIGY